MFSLKYNGFKQSFQLKTFKGDCIHWYMPTVDSTFTNENKIDEIENSTVIHGKRPTAVTFEERSRF